MSESDVFFVKFAQMYTNRGVYLYNAILVTKIFC